MCKFVLGMKTRMRGIEKAELEGGVLKIPDAELWEDSGPGAELGGRGCRDGMIY